MSCEVLFMPRKYPKMHAHILRFISYPHDSDQLGGSSQEGPLAGIYNFGYLDRSKSGPRLGKLKSGNLTLDCP